MIYIDRSRVPEPEIFRSKEMEEARRHAAYFFARSRDADEKGSRAQERFEFDGVWLESCRSALQEMSYGKCAYCETGLEFKTFAVDRFRPESGAVGDGGELAPDHYWWLALEWSNLYPSCQICSRSKGRSFPVVGERAGPGTLGDAIDQSEMRRLIDPCFDEPLDHLRFDRKAATWVPRTAGDPLAEWSIKVFDLARSDLERSRRQVSRQFDSIWRSFSDVVTIDSFVIRLLSLVNDPVRHAGVSRSLLRDVILRTEESPNPSMHPLLVEALRNASQTTRLVVEAAEEDQRSIEESFEVSSKGAFSLSLDEAASDADLDPEPIIFSEEAHQVVTSDTMQSITIENFRSIESLSIDLPLASTSGTAWKVVLGENGTGKSSVLKAVAIALQGIDGYEKARRYIQPKALLRRWTDKDGNVQRADRGHVKVTMISGEEIEYEFDEKELRFLKGGGGVDAPIRAFGSSRLLPLAVSKDEGFEYPEVREIRNLFDPRFEMVDTDHWLGLRKGDEFSPIGLALKDLLGLTKPTDASPAVVTTEVDELVEPAAYAGGQIVPADDGIWVEMNDTKVRLTELSDGYQSVLALGVDIMASLRSAETDLSSARGIVLIDELGSHLHPRWRMAIVGSLRRAFKGMQFLCTTHEPLCLIGLEQDEIAILRRTKGDDGGTRVELIDEELPDPKGMRADQILTSRLFGLDSTIDPAINERFERYYALLAHRDRLDDDQKKALDRLRDEVQKHRVLGYTRRDQLLYEILDEFLADERKARGPEERRQLKDATKERLRKVWKRTGLDDLAKG